MPQSSVVEQRWPIAHLVAHRPPLHEPPKTARVTQDESARLPYNVMHPTNPRAPVHVSLHRA